MIEVQGLTKSYGGRKAIDDLNFEVKEGEIVGFLGPNGAGKTTTMKIITGFMAANEGLVKVDGFDVFESPIEVKSRIGYLPETPPVYMDMSVEDYLGFVAAIKCIDKAKIAKAIDEALEKTSLGDVRSRIIGNLSKGYRQRVGLAQALIGSPKVLVLDEPTVGLDPKQVADMRGLLNRLRGQHTIILSTHILSEVEATCGRVVIINKGRIIAKDSIESLKTKIKGNRILQLKVRRNPEQLAEKIKAMQGVQTVEQLQHSLNIITQGDESMIEKISEMAVSSGSGLLEYSQQGAGLEDVFIQLTGQSFEGGEAHV